ncbi:serine/threonine-protein kinase [Amycolatopsis alkalitolerans]|uniref:serine/threonine-protein kinase n=1 Tax=Amycolatopsis alkalitolerans TaxID=2547244 RepID=UPI00135BB48E|nr:serine/threonine-protein kinase [Amycolatopsis alkalitolerans]
MRTGDVIDRRYRLEDELGSGAGGVVWSAYDTKLHRTVALKRAHGVPSASGFGREARNAARLHHPHVISVFDTVDPDWLVMEYLPSRGLDRIVAAGPLPAGRVARIGMQIAAGLTAAHARGVVHRDVKPGNILVGEGDLAKLTDFGISVWREATLTEDGRISGTAAYMAPEVARGQAATAASDVFSLGATLFAAVEGTPPFGTGAPEAVLARARRGEIPPMRHAGPLAPLLGEMLAVRPGQRPAAEQVRSRLAEIAGPWRPPEVPPSPSRRFTPWWAVAAAVVVVTAAVFTWSVLATGPAPEPSTVDVIGDPTTADPCALAGQHALRPFGTTSLNPVYGNFDRCDVLIDVGAGDPLDVEFELAAASVPGAVRPGQFPVERHPLSDDACDRRIAVSTGYDVWITAKMDNPPRDLCAVADTATNAALIRLRQGPLPRRAPFAPRSLATTDACGLLDGPALARLPGVDAIHPEIGFGGWDCTWHSTIDHTSVRILFDHSQPMSADDGTPTRVAGRDAFVKADDDQDHSCTAKVVQREFPDQNGDPLDEIMKVIVAGDGTGARFCPMARDFAAAAAAKLP